MSRKSRDQPLLIQLSKAFTSCHERVRKGRCSRVSSIDRYKFENAPGPLPPHEPAPECFKCTSSCPHYFVQSYLVSRDLRASMWWGAGCALLRVFGFVDVRPSSEATRSLPRLGIGPTSLHHPHDIIFATAGNTHLPQHHATLSGNAGPDYVRDYHRRKGGK